MAAGLFSSLARLCVRRSPLLFPVYTECGRKYCTLYVPEAQKAVWMCLSEGMKTFKNFDRASFPLSRIKKVKINTFAICNIQFGGVVSQTRRGNPTVLTAKNAENWAKIRKNGRVSASKHRTSLPQTSVLLMQNLRTFAQRSPMFPLFRAENWQKTAETAHKRLMPHFCDISDHGFLFRFRCPSRSIIGAVPVPFFCLQRRL